MSMISLMEMDGLQERLGFAVTEKQDTSDILSISERVLTLKYTISVNVCNVTPVHSFHLYNSSLRTVFRDRKRRCRLSQDFFFFSGDHAFYFRRRLSTLVHAVPLYHCY